MRLVLGALCLSLLPVAMSADTFTVTHLGDSGPATLRRSIHRANTRIGPDTITFAPRHAGGVIKPLTALAALTDPETTIDGDPDGDGHPDISLNGIDCSDGTGLALASSGHTIRGLCINNWSAMGIHIQSGADGNTVAGCYLGTNQAGTSTLPNGNYDIFIEGADGNTIGGSDDVDRNLFTCGSIPDSEGVSTRNECDNVVIGNHFGLGPDGVTVLPDLGDCGVLISSNDGLSPATGNYVGGFSVHRRNVFAGLGMAVLVQGSAASQNTIAGNYVGLAADGDTVAGCGSGVVLSATDDNVVGSVSNPAGRNVIAGDAGNGVEITDGASGNVVAGNLLGMNAAGTATRAQGGGVFIGYGAGNNLVGGTEATAANYIATGYGDPNPHEAVHLIDAGAANTIRGNKLGMGPDGKALRLQTGIALDGSAAWIIGNEIRGAHNAGIAAYNPPPSGTAIATGNQFSECSYGVDIWDDGRINLGNLGNPLTFDDGGNRFDPSNSFHIRNLTPARIRAEGNDFGMLSPTEIDNKIRDNEENPGCGVVDFLPLMAPTAAATPTAVLTATAAPAGSGAEVVFALSAPASVTARVLNIAGRPVRVLCADAPYEAGTSRLLWDARANTGLPAPAGVYLVEITACSPHGERCRAVAPVRLVPR